jgi:signal transduction histidine kinase
MILGSPWQLSLYALPFATAGVVAGAAAFRAQKIEAAETRLGMVGLLVTTSAWAFLQIGLLIVPTVSVAYVLYVLSLIIGLATVGAWLYFCSAYTGRSFHREPVYRRAAVLAYLAIVGVKLTNPLHGLYFSAELTSGSFVYLAVQHEVFHWVVSGIAYALAAVGLFMLYEMFPEVSYDTTPLAVLAGVTALPVAFDILGFTTAGVLELNYEPLGVAVFAVGVLFVFKDRFFAVQLAEGVDEPVAHLDSQGRIRELNGHVRGEFPQLAGSVGESFAEAFPAAARLLDSTDQILETSQDGDTRYHVVTDVSASLGRTSIAQSVVFTDVTDAEMRRRELERHNAQLEGFAAAIRHNILNTLQVILSRLDHAETELQTGDIQAANESLTRASKAAGGMSDTVSDLATLAREGQTVETTHPLPVGETARDAFANLETENITLSVETDGTIQANQGRLRRLFETSFDFALYNDASSVTVAVHESGLVVADDGDPPTHDEVDDLFEYGEAVPDSEAGMILPNLQMLARTHGWEVTVDTEYQQGFRFVVVTDKGVATNGQSVPKAMRL